MRTVYRVDCVGGIIYVGETGNYNKRIKCHFRGKGSQVTRRFSPVSATPVCEVDYEIAKKVEKEYTSELMSMYGSQRVRGGGAWTNSLTLVPLQESCI